MSGIPAFAIALAFAAIHVFGAKATQLRATPRSAWLSLAGGISIAYVFVHILPELAEHQSGFDRNLEAARSPAASLESHVYVIAMTGLAAFYGLERFARPAARPHGGSMGARSDRANASATPRPSGAFWLHLASFALYNALVGYLLVHRDETDALGLALYACAVAFHFLVNDQALRGMHGSAYDRYGRWVLALAPLCGWGLGATTQVAPLGVSALFAFLAGGIVLNVLKEELPEERESRFWAFALGAGGYAAILLAAG